MNAFEKERKKKPHESYLRIHFPQCNLQEIVIVEGKGGIRRSSFEWPWNKLKNESFVSLMLTYSEKKQKPAPIVAMINTGNKHYPTKIMEYWCIQMLNHAALYRNKNNKTKIYRCKKNNENTTKDHTWISEQKHFNEIRNSNLWWLPLSWGRRYKSSH